MKRRRIHEGLGAAVAVALLVLGGCGRSAADARGAPLTEISIGCDGDEMAFDVTEFDARAGSLFRLTFLNDAPTAKVYHNLLILRPGSEERVTVGAIEVGFEQEWVPDTTDVLAHSRLLRPGEQDTFTFVVPAAGDYPFLCSVPGHAFSMRGMMHSR